MGRACNDATPGAAADRNMHDRPGTVRPLAAVGGALLVALLLLALSYQLGATPLFEDPNEGQYAEVAREMVETGE